MSGGQAPGTMRVWDGSAWIYPATDWVEPYFEFIRTGQKTSSTTTSTTCSRTPDSVHKGALVTVTASTTGRRGGYLTFFFKATAGTVRKIVSRAAPDSGGSVSVTHVPTENGTYYAVFSGSPGYLPSTSPETATVAVQRPAHNYETLSNKWVQAYTGLGAKITATGRDTAVHQGYYSDTLGNRKSLLGFSPLGLITGAKITKVVLRCNGAWSNWMEGRGTVVVGAFYGNNAKPTTWPTSGVQSNLSRKEVGIGTWTVDISSWACAALERADFSGIVLGPGPTTGFGYFGYSNTTVGSGDFTLVVDYNYWM